MYYLYTPTRLCWIPFVIVMLYSAYKKNSTAHYEFMTHVSFKLVCKGLKTRVEFPGLKLIVNALMGWALLLKTDMPAGFTKHQQSRMQRYFLSQVAKGYHTPVAITILPFAVTYDAIKRPQTSLFNCLVSFYLKHRAEEMHLARPCKIAHIFFLLCLWNIGHDREYLENFMNGRLVSSLILGIVIGTKLWRHHASVVLKRWDTFVLVDVCADFFSFRMVTFLLIWLPRVHAIHVKVKHLHTFH